MWKAIILDDERQVLQGMKNMIPWEEFDIVCSGEAMDGQAGLELVEQVEPDLVITDVYMPVMDGLTFIEKLRERGFPGKIIILSGYQDFEYARQALRLQVDDYLTKPATLETIKEVLERAVGGLEAQAAKQMAEEEMQGKLELYQPFYKKEWLKSFVTGTRPDKENDFTHVDHPLVHSACQGVLAVEMMRGGRVQTASISDWHLFRFAVQQLLKELLDKVWPQSELVELHSHYFLVLLYADASVPAEDFIATCGEVAEQLYDGVDHFLNIQVKVGIGGITTSISDMRTSTEEAFSAIIHQRNPHHACKDVYRYMKNNQRAGQGSSDEVEEMWPFPYYHRLSEAIQHAQEKKALQVISEFMTEVEGRELKPSSMQRISSSIWTVISYALFDSGFSVEELFPGGEKEREGTGITKPEHLEAWLTGLLQQISEHAGWNENLRHKQAVDFMIDYIHDHYAEEITLTEIADQVYLSRNYLSLIFKNMTGETFNSYVTKVRMEKAKSLLLEGKLLIYEIAEQVGYKNIPYFSTLFKKHTGYNPSELIKS
ncbi:response regulator [Marinicrinis sediminis]|uniref:Response regulator n=1 Tax=Marinicrinis sediminis TaxID=1652465 RepID=A0ABW5RGT2_9BACL